MNVKEKKGDSIEHDTTYKLAYRDDAKTSPSALIAAIRNGDEEAFTSFYSGYADSLVNFLTKMLHNEEEAKEVTQETFIQLWENRESFSPHTSLKSYVFTIARNAAFRVIESHKRSSEWHSDYRNFVEEFSSDADEIVISRDTELLIDTLIEMMPEQRRKVFEMSRTEGLTYNEIAERLNISYNTVRTHIERAKEEIKSMLVTVAIFLFLT